jgi:hypothetical protein
MDAAGFVLSIAFTLIKKPQPQRAKIAPRGFDPQ